MGCGSSSLNNDDQSVQMIKRVIESNKVLIYSKTYCPYCKKTKQLFQTEFPDVPVKIVELDTDPCGDVIQAALLKLSGQSTVPNVYVNKIHIGGNDDTHAAFRSGKLAKMIAE